MIVKNKLLFWIIPPLLAWLLIYGTVASSYPWNSDFTSIILTVGDIFKGKMYLSPDTFLIKYPMILILDQFVEYGRKYMWFLQMANGAVMVLGVGWYFLDFAKRFVDKKISGWIVMATLFYLATMSYDFFGYTVHPFLRNAEIALMFLFLMVFRKSKWWSLPILAGMLINDAYFTFVFVMPLIISEMVAVSVKKKDLQVSAKMFFLVAGVILAYWLRDKGLNHTPYFWIFEERTSFHGWESLGTTISMVAESMVRLVGMDFFGLEFFSGQAITAILSGGLAIFAGAGLVKMFADGIKKSRVEMILPLISTVVTIGAAMVSTNFVEMESGRFLIIVCFWLALGMMYYLWKIRGIKRLFWVTILGVILISGLKGGVIEKKNRQNNFWKDNFYYLELVNFLKKNDLHYGYSGFWTSGITTFLAKNEVKIRQVKCGGTGIGIHEWVMVDRWYRPENYEGKTFVLVSSFGKDRGILDECADIRMTGQFGEPTKVLEYEGDKIFVYDYNVAERF